MATRRVRRNKSRKHLVKKSNKSRRNRWGRGQPVGNVAKLEEAQQLQQASSLSSRQRQVQTNWRAKLADARREADKAYKEAADNELIEKATIETAKAKGGKRSRKKTKKQKRRRRRRSRRGGVPALKTLFELAKDPKKVAAAQGALGNVVTHFGDIAKNPEQLAKVATLQESLFKQGSIGSVARGDDNKWGNTLGKLGRVKTMMMGPSAFNSPS